MSTPRLLILGAGPIGLAAALGGVRRGWEVTVLEKGEVGASIRRWGATRFFSPLSMNLPSEVADLLGERLPAGDCLLTGPEFVEAVLEPLAESAPLLGRVKTGHRAIAIGRAGLTRCDYARHPLRAERLFRVLAESASGEQVLEAEAVIDATGTYDQPLWLGAGGLPAVGERALRDRLIRTLGALEERLPRLAGREILLMGSGHSAANAIARLACLARMDESTRVVWAVRTLNRRPCVEVASDPLPERAHIAGEANRLAMQPPPWLHVERRAAVEALEPLESGRLHVRLSGERVLDVDEVIGLTGYRPDTSLFSELNVSIDPATEGAAGLSNALANVADCLAVPAVSPVDLHSGEPGFYLAGLKSYGRAPTFLLKTGYCQLETILRQLDATIGGEAR